MQNTPQQYAFLVGSAKSGTTKLADLLDLHPEISVSSDKEPDTFARNDVSAAVMAEYDTLFEPNSTIRIDASTSYSEGTNSLQIAKRLAEVDPNAKILYLVRNPAKRAWSSYWHYVRNGTEKREPMAAITNQTSPHFVGSCFNLHVANYVSVFGRDNVRVIQFEDFIKQADDIYQQIITFLGLENVTLEQDESTKTKNKSYQWRGPAAFLKHVNPKYIQKTTKVLKSLLPESALEKLRNSATKPVPDLNDADYATLAALFEADHQSLQQDYADLFIKPTSSK